MKKLALILALALTLGLFGCAGESGPQSENETASASAGESWDDFDFAGKQFLIYEGEYVSESKTLTRSTLLYSPAGSVQEDLLNERIAQFGARHNCTVKTEIDPALTFQSNVLNSAALSDDIGDVFICSNGGFPSTFAQAGLLTPINEVSEIIDLSDTAKYGTKGELEAVTVASLTYAVTPAALPGMQNFGTVPIGVFAEEFMSENNLPSIREYLEKKTWTWDTFLTCLSDCTLDDGENSVRAITFANFVFTNAALLSNGVSFAVKTETGYESGIDSPETLAALEFQKKVLTDYGDSVIADIYTWGTEYQTLRDGKAVMCLQGAWTIVSEIPYELSHYGLFPFPWGPSGEYGVCRTLSDGIVSVMIPLSAEDADYSAYLISELLEPLEGYDTEEDLKAYYSNIFFDERDIDFFMSLRENTSFSYFPGGGYTFSQSVGSQLKNQSASELLETYKDSMNAVIENYIIPNGEYLFG